MNPSRRWSRGTMAGGVLVTLCVALFALLASALIRDELERLDRFGIDLVEPLRSGFSDVFFAAITWAGSSLVLVPSSALLAWWFRAKGRTLVAPLILAPALAVLLQNILKPLFDRTRPEAGVLAELGPSFPSGHSTAAAAVWLTVCYVLIRERMLPGIAMIVAWLVMLLVGVSRIYLGVHWPSDVVAGWSVGVIIAVSSALTYERVRRARPSP